MLRCIAIGRWHAAVNEFDGGVHIPCENIAALDGPAFSTEELEQIDTLSDSIDVDLWAESAEL